MVGYSVSSARNGAAYSDTITVALTVVERAEKMISSSVTVV